MGLNRNTVKRWSRAYANAWPRRASAIARSPGRSSRLVGVDLNNNGQFADAGDRRFEYDALGRRVQETTGGMTSDLYYSDRSKVSLEEQSRVRP